MVRIKFEASDEELKSIREELSKWSVEELILDMNLRPSFLDYENPERTRIGWITYMLEEEEFTRRGYVRCFSVSEGGKQQ